MIVVDIVCGCSIGWAGTGSSAGQEDPIGVGIDRSVLGNVSTTLGGPSVFVFISSTSLPSALHLSRSAAAPTISLAGNSKFPLNFATSNIDPAPHVWQGAPETETETIRCLMLLG